MSRSTRSVNVSSSQGWRMESLIGLPSGETSGPSTPDSGVASWIAWLRASRASHSQSLGNAGDRPTRETSGPMSGESLMNPDPQLSFWRMCPGRCHISSMSSCPSYKRWATGLRRDCLWRLKSARRTAGSASSSWPTPIADDASGSGYCYSQGNHDRPVLKLTGVAKKWATPTARDWKDGSGPSRKAPTNSLLGRQAPRSGIVGPLSSPGGPISPRPRLNPRFVEWLMGLPVGWTDFAPLGTQSPRPKQL
jgi:DNA (cytosine-5)-methyltransferase 1